MVVLHVNTLSKTTNRTIPNTIKTALFYNSVLANHSFRGYDDAIQNQLVNYHQNMKDFNDSPIKSPSEDNYGVTAFADSLARSILNIEKPIGTTIALNGEWGSGKSSIVNLVRSKLSDSEDKNLVVSEFKCWWFRGEDALALAFLQNLDAVIKENIGESAKDLVPKLGRALLQAGLVLGQAVVLATTEGAEGPLISGTRSLAKELFPEVDPLDKIFNELEDELEKCNHRFLIIIDDIDRLNPDEALAIFRLVKSVGHLPNVIYLLVFDRALADEVVSEKYPSEGPHYLEKIVQAVFEVPLPLQVDLNDSMLSSIESICGIPEGSELDRTINIFYDAIVPLIKTPRHVNRFKNAISVTWPAIADEISLADFLALEAIRLYEPVLFQSIRHNKQFICGRRQDSDPNGNDDGRFDRYMDNLTEPSQELAKIVLQRLFPRLEVIGYDVNHESIWNSERRVCIAAHFDTYFRLSLSDETLPMESINELVTRADDKEFVQSTMRKAASQIRRNRSSMVSIFLDELMTHAGKIPTEKIESLLTALFEVHDEIALEIDEAKDGFSIGNTRLRYHWLIRRLTRGRFTIGERTKIYENALQTASLGWFVDFVSSAKRDYEKNEDSNRSEENCLTTEDVIPELVQSALIKITSAAADGSLLAHTQLMRILFCWKDFDEGKADDVKAWTDSQLEDDDAVVVFAKRMTVESWSQSYGMPGLGDVLPTKSIQAMISDDTDILDASKFREKLERIRDSKSMDNESLKVVSVFLDAWDEGPEGDSGV